MEPTVKDNKGILWTRLYHQIQQARWNGKIPERQKLQKLIQNNLIFKHNTYFKN